MSIHVVKYGRNKFDYNDKFKEVHGIWYDVSVALYYWG